MIMPVRGDTLSENMGASYRAASRAKSERTMSNGENRIHVNRAPVLTLWAAVVAERLGFERDEALTLGRALAGLTAHAKGAGAGGRVPLGGRGRRRAALPLGDDDPGPRRGAGGGAGRALPRAVRDRGRAGRAEDAPARRAGRAAQQDAGAGAAGVLGAAAGPLR